MFEELPGGRLRQTVWRRGRLSRVDRSRWGERVGYEMSSSLFYVYSSCAFAASLQRVTWTGYDDRPKRRRGCSSKVFSTAPPTMLARRAFPLISSYRPKNRTVTHTLIVLFVVQERAVLQRGFERRSWKKCWCSTIRHRRQSGIRNPEY